MKPVAAKKSKHCAFADLDGAHVYLARRIVLALFLLILVVAAPVHCKREFNQKQPHWVTTATAAASAARSAIFAEDWCKAKSLHNQAVREWQNNPLPVREDVPAPAKAESLNFPDWFKGEFDPIGLADPERTSLQQLSEKIAIISYDGRVAAEWGAPSCDPDNAYAWLGRQQPKWTINAISARKAMKAHQYKEAKSFFDKAYADWSRKPGNALPYANFHENLPNWRQGEFSPTSVYTSKDSLRGLVEDIQLRLHQAELNGVLDETGLEKDCLDNVYEQLLKTGENADEDLIRFYTSKKRYKDAITLLEKKLTGYSKPYTEQRIAMLYHQSGDETTADHWLQQAKQHGCENGDWNVERAQREQIREEIFKRIPLYILLIASFCYVELLVRLRRRSKYERMPAPAAFVIGAYALNSAVWTLLPIVSQLFLVLAYFGFGTVAVLVWMFVSLRLRRPYICGRF